MRKIIFILFFSALLLSATQPELQKNNISEVDQIEGIYIFYHSKPLAKYEYLGTYKIGVIWDDKPKLLLPKLIHKTKEKYPAVQGIIIGEDMEQCDAVKFN